MAAKKYIRIRQGKIRVNDHVAAAIAALRLILVLHVCGMLVVPVFATCIALNGWLIFALGLFIVGTVSTASSLGAIVRLSGNVSTSLNRAWAEQTHNKLVSSEILSLVAPLYPRLLDPGPVFGLFSGVFLAGAWGMAAIGMLRLWHAAPHAF